MEPDNCHRSTWQAWMKDVYLPIPHSDPVQQSLHCCGPSDAAFGWSGSFWRQGSPHLHQGAMSVTTFSYVCTTLSVFIQYLTILPPQHCKVYLFVGCLTSQQHASVSQGRICSEKCTCCHTETEDANQTFYLTQSQYTDTGPTIPVQVLTL